MQARTERGFGIVEARKPPIHSDGCGPGTAEAKTGLCSRIDGMDLFRHGGKWKVPRGLSPTFLLGDKPQVIEECVPF